MEHTLYEYIISIMPKVKQGPVAVYDFTLPAEGVEADAIISSLKGLSKKYAFQLEESDSGYKHYQGRLSLIKKRRPGKTLSLLREHDAFEKVHLSVTSNNAKGDDLYVLKDDTRIGGPWTDKDEKRYVPRQVRDITVLRPFQETILDMVKTYDPRVIDVIYCPEGNKGKSVLIGKARALGLRVLPPVFDYKDILRMVYCMPTATSYFVDMPRAIKKDKLAGFFAGLETIKDGYAYDDRYTFKEKTFDSPRIFMFTNKLPETGYLSADRWKFWTIDNSFALVPYRVPVVPTV